MKDLKAEAKYFCNLLTIPESVFNTDDDSPDAVAGRWIVWWLLYQRGHTLVNIAAATSGGAHAPIYYSCERLEGWRASCPAFRRYLDESLGGIPSTKPPSHLMFDARKQVGEVYKCGDQVWYYGPYFSPKGSRVVKAFHRKGIYTLILENGDHVLESMAVPTREILISKNIYDVARR